MQICEVFKALGDETRLRILNLLMERELCVCQIIEALRLTQPNASKHLNRLRYTGIISCRKIAQWCFYSVKTNFIDENRLLLDYLQDKWQYSRFYTEDRQRLHHLLENTECCKRQKQCYKN